MKNLQATLVNALLIAAQTPEGFAIVNFGYTEPQARVMPHTWLRLFTRGYLESAGVDRFKLSKLGRAYLKSVKSSNL